MQANSIRQKTQDSYDQVKQELDALEDELRRNREEMKKLKAEINRTKIYVDEAIDGMNDIKNTVRDSGLIEAASAASDLGFPDFDANFVDIDLNNPMAGWNNLNWVNSLDGTGLGDLPELTLNMSGIQVRDSSFPLTTFFS